MGCPGLEAGPPRCWDVRPILPEPWFWVCKMGRERGFLVNSNQVTCTLEVVTMGPPYPQGKRPEPMKPDPLGAAVFWRDHPTFKGDYPPKVAGSELEHKDLSLPNGLSNR